MGLCMGATPGVTPTAVTFATFLSMAVCVQSLPTDRPWIIAHGGASGPLPGNTIQAYQRAIAVGANLITCEVVVTKDQQVHVMLRLHNAHEPCGGGDDAVEILAYFDTCSALCAVVASSAVCYTVVP